MDGTTEKDLTDELAVAGAMTAVDSAIVTDVAKRVDVSDRRDLRRRLADGLEEWLLKHRAGHQLLPSARHFSDAWGVHRATVQGAFEILVDRGTLTRTANGRFVANFAATVREDGAAALAGRLRAAAGMAIRDGLSESAFIEFARQMFRAAALGDLRVVFVEPEVEVPGMGPEDLARLLDYPVSSERLESIEPAPRTVFVALASDATKARAKMAGRADVFAIGLTLETDLRLAVAGLPAETSVAVVSEDRRVLGAVMDKLSELRSDLSIHSYTEIPRELGDTSLLLLPEAMEADTGNLPTARYRCQISLAELTFLRSRLAGSMGQAATAADTASDHKKIELPAQ
ncbi:DNA-binding transcriptional regulator YhcF (GntR family) [Arthrobacter sp. 2762]